MPRSTHASVILDLQFHLFTPTDKKLCTSELELNRTENGHAHYDKPIKYRVKLHQLRTENDGGFNQRFATIT